MIAECDTRLALYREALEAGTDPKLVAQWTAEVQARSAGHKAEVHRNLGPKLTYEPGKQLMRAEAALDPHKLGIWSVSEGGLEPPRPIKGTSTSS